MTPNTILCLQNQLKADSRYLQRSAQKAIQAIHARVTKQNEVALVVLRGMLVEAGALQFDLITKTKTIEKLVTVDDNRYICDFLGALFQNPGVGSSSEATNARKIIADLLTSACTHRLAGDQEFQGSTTEEHAVTFAYGRSPLLQSRNAVEVLVKVAFFVDPAATPEVAPASRQYVRERIMVCLEQALKQKTIGRALLRHTIAYISAFESKRLRPAFDFDENIKTIMRDARRRLDAVSGSLFLDEDSGQRGDKHFSENDTSSADEDSEDEGDHSPEHKIRQGKGVDETYGSGTTDGIILLYHLALLQVYSGEAEAVTILEDLNAYHAKLADDDKLSMGSDVLIEVLLTFASKPSKFLRKISLQAFSSFAAQITEEGLQSLVRVLETKENLQGQGEMFDVEDPEDDTMNGINGEDSDVQVDSDVEEISDREEHISGAASDAELNGQDNKDEEEEEDEEQLSKFDAMLAAALGTRKGEDDLAASDTSGSDEDMSDSEMEALDEKLTEVFRARKELAKPKKKEHKDAKENVVNFKNRVLDLVDVYLKQEHANPLSLPLVLPLLRLARKTNVKQLADRACGILREFNGRCRGGAKLAQLVQKEHVQAALDVFQEIHLEAGLPGSNAHAAACSSASILLVRVLSHAGVGAATLWGVYAATGTRMLEEKDCHVQPAFFTDWNNWCANARKALAK
jgi:DNA polymerase phi